jgi:hypothetical protein
LNVDPIICVINPSDLKRKSFRSKFFDLTPSTKEMISMNIGRPIQFDPAEYVNKLKGN